jgi:hypothetical protein
LDSKEALLPTVIFGRYLLQRLSDPRLLSSPVYRLRRSLDLDQRSTLLVPGLLPEAEHLEPLKVIQSPTLGALIPAEGKAALFPGLVDAGRLPLVLESRGADGSGEFFEGDGCEGDVGEGDGVAGNDLGFIFRWAIDEDLI